MLRSAVIYHGIFASGFFQRLYAPDPVQPFMFCTSLSYHVFINLPTLVLAAYFPAFVPLAAVCVGVSACACVLAAAQADLPAKKRRFWSRPLVALLFFLQPVVRGWARFKRRLDLLSTERRVVPEPPPAGSAVELPDTAVYWSKGSVTRYAFLKGILSKLDQSGWGFRTDTGWTTYDVEIPALFWIRLRLTTVSEELEQGKMNFRCRIRGSWSLAGRIVFGGVAVAVAALILGLATTTPWIWLSLIALPLVFWALEEERHEYERSLAALVDTVANQQGLASLASHDAKSS